MSYTDTTPMADVFEGLRVADAGAAEAFVRRQAADEIGQLARQLPLLRDTLRRHWMSRPGELATFEWPQAPTPMPAALVQDGLNAAQAGETEKLDALLQAQHFADLMMFMSLSNFLADSARRHMRKAV